MQTNTATNSILNALLECVEETLYKAQLTGKPFVLGIAPEKPDGDVIRTVNENRQAFEKLGAAKFEWRDDALRSVIDVAGENVFVSVQGVR